MKKFLPHLIVIAVFAALTMISFAPLFSGKEIRQTDINNWKGMSKEIIDHNESSDEPTYWTNSMFGGMPAYQISAVYDGNVVTYIDKILTLGLPTPANYVFLFMIGFYFLLITLRVDPKVAVLGAIGFAFSSYFFIVIEAGHNSKAHAIGYMAPVIAGIIMTYRGRLLSGMAITALALSLELSANHLQITYYLMLTVIILVISELYMAIREKRLAYFAKASGLLIVSALIAVMPNITNLITTQEYGKYSTRGPSELSADKDNQTTGLDRDYITDWSYGIGESLTFLVPDFKGGASEAITQNNRDALQKVNSNMRQYVGGFSAYFGDQPFTSGPVYIGAIICLLFVLGAFTLKGPLKWWLVISSLLSLLLSWGRNFMAFTNFFLDVLPGYDKFRAVSMTLVILEFAFPLLAVLAVDQMIREKDFFTKYRKKIYYAFGIVGGLALLITIAPGTLTSFYTQKEYDQVAESLKSQQGAQQILDDFFEGVTVAREHIVTSDATRSLLFLLVAGVLIFTYIRFRYHEKLFIYGLIALVFLDLFTVDKRYLENDDYVKKTANSAPFPFTPADAMIKQDTTSYRVLNMAANVFNDAGTSYYHQSIGGYHGAKLKRYKELIDYRLAPELAAIRAALQSQDTSAISKQTSVNMLNTKYIIYNPEAPPLVNSGALGNAWFVTEVKRVANADEEIRALDNFNPATTAIVDERFNAQLNNLSIVPDPSAYIRLVSYDPDHLVYESNASSDQVAVFSEIYYDKGWNAYVDGAKTDYFRTNYVLRGMKVPSGKHTIEWKFEPESVKTGETIAYTGSALLLLLLGFAGFNTYRKRSPQG